MPDLDKRFASIHHDLGVEGRYARIAADTMLLVASHDTCIKTFLEQQSDADITQMARHIGATINVFDEKRGPGGPALEKSVKGYLQKLSNCP